jgi:redox-sensitive bicupin YhaK (pirin superfamily)
VSKLEANDPVCTRHGGTVRVQIKARSRDLGGFSVRRVLPSAMARRVGPFVFFDEMGPADFAPGTGINVRPHPHIGLATVTFLLEGEILHRDSLGFVQPIQPGAVNLMTAGKGIVHSERTDPLLERDGQRLHGLQVWMALPQDQQEIDPDFVHYPKECLPVIEKDGLKTTVIIGQYAGLVSPVRVRAETLYLAQILQESASYELETGMDQQAVYVVSGQITIGGQKLEAGVMAVLEPGCVYIEAGERSQIMVIGGEDVGPREIYWNFVHTSRDRIEAAKQDWREGNFARVPGDEEFIPLPGD